MYQYICPVHPMTFQDMLDDFEVVSQLLVTFFKNFVELKRKIASLIEEYKKGKVPTDVVITLSLT